MLARAFAEAWAKGIRMPQSAAAPAARDLELVGQKPPVEVQAFIQNYVDSARLLGRRTAELHLALAGDAANPDFAPEPFTIADQRAIYASMHERGVLSLRALERTLDAGSLPESVRAGAQRVLGLEQQILDRYRSLLAQEVTAMRTRLHGDYHLGQVLYTGDDFLIIDFEGEPARPLSERRRKGSPVQDIAGMLRSFHYAPYAVLFGQAPGFVFGAEQIAALEPWAGLWHRWVSAAFLETYLATAGEAPFLPRSRAPLATLLDAFLLDPAGYELNYELNNRPAWVQIPVAGVLQLLGSS
jgi:maltose alpha-D-glucosyltransferase/alpha-amylase